ncbi:MAG: DegV family protein [Anaerolineales bacterium]|nr:DegV family protein [Anaerolineales bacterium]
MPKITIITDTDASLPANLVTRYGIHTVPVIVNFEEESLASGVDIDDASLFARVDREGKLPTTSAPSPGQFADAYQTAFDNGADEVLCFCVSSAVSAIYNSACNAAEEFPGHQIHVVDTQSLSMAQGFMVLAAAEAIAAGASSQQAIDQAISVRERTCLYAALATLKYLAMSGRVGYLAAGMANLLNVKPILTIREGKLDLLERVRTQQKAWGRVIELSAQYTAGTQIERLAIVHANAPQQAAAFCQQLCARLPCPTEIITAELTPGLSVHAGSGVVGATITIK